jgi:hypothetical protein
VLALLIPPAILVAGWLLQPRWGWLTMMALLVAFIVLIGHHIAGAWRGALIDERNKISLSRFQTIVWTVLVVAAFLAAALHNIRTGQPDPLRIAVPSQLWALLGISVTSLVGSGLVKQEKTKRTPETHNAKKTLATALPGVDPTKITPVAGNQLVAAKDPQAPRTDDRVVARGVLTVNEHPAESSWSDMFRAEEVGNAGNLDLGKIQMFYFTLIIVFAYAAALGSLLVHPNGKIAGFPALGNEVVGLLGISHATYLTTKAVTRTPGIP